MKIFPRYTVVLNGKTNLMTDSKQKAALRVKELKALKKKWLVELIDSEEVEA